MATSKKTILILGGSYGGVSTAHYLLKHAIPVLPEKSSYEIVLVSTSSETMSRPACPRALISDDFFQQDKLFVSIPKVFEQYPEGSFRFVQGTATKLDHNTRKVTISLKGGSTEDIDYYALLIATGASTTSPLMGFNKDEDYLRSKWNEFREALPAAKSIVIAGGGPTGVETAGELGEYLNGRAWFFNSKLDAPKVKITLVTSGSEILPVLRSSIAQKAEVYLAKVGVTIVKNARVTAVSPSDAGTESNLATKATVTLANGETLEADLYIPAVGTQPNTTFIDSTLLTSDKRVDTNISTLRVDKAGPRVYAVGDAASFARPACHNIFNAIPILAANIKRDLLLDAGVDEKSVKEERIHVEDTRETHLVPIGQTKGVGAAMGWQVPSFFVWLIKGRDYWLWNTDTLWSGRQWAKEI